MKNVGLVLKPKLIEAKALVLDIAAWLQKNNIPLIVESRTAALCKEFGIVGFEEVSELREVPASCTHVISVGGDGTLIGVARLVNSDETIMIGVNFGTLGYLAEVSTNKLFLMLDQLKNGTAQTATRSMLSAKLLGDQKKSIFKTQALNGDKEGPVLLQNK